jgi:OFA family oxalate/formate antiporter-like MFS transporter
MCLGATYSWSVFVRFLREYSGISQARAQIPFTIFYIAFPLTTIYAGRLLERWGPRRLAMTGACTFAAGWMVAGLHHHIAVTALGVGLISGIGAGFAYIVPIAVGMQWFPHRKGLITGVGVAGFGGGAALISQVSQYLMAGRGWTPQMTLGGLGTVFMLLAVPAASFLRSPPDAGGPRALRLELPRFLHERNFRLLYVAMIAGLAAGFTVSANLVQFNPGLGVGHGVRAVALFALANAAGRIFWGLLSDRLAAGVTLRANLLAQAVVIGMHPLLLRTPTGLALLAIGAGFNYGGVLVLYAASTGRLWNIQHVGRIYGALFSSNIPASLAPLLAGMAFDAWGNFSGALFILVGGLVLAAITIRFERTPAQTSQEPADPPPAKTVPRPEHVGTL